MSALPVVIRPTLDDALIEAVTRGLSSVSTRMAYTGGLRDFLNWWRNAGRPNFDRDTVHRYRMHLEEGGAGTATINQKLSAIRKLAEEAMHAGVISRGARDGIAAVKGIKQRGSVTGQWLTRDASVNLMLQPEKVCNDTVMQLRDQAVLSVLLGTGLRREEVAIMEFDQLQQRDDRWCFVNVTNKARVRPVPLPDWVYQDIQAWTSAAGISGGRIFRRLSSGASRNCDKPLSGQGVWRIVKKYGLEPHDLRRTFAQIALDHGATLKQIKDALGHGALSTTEQYLSRIPNLVKGKTACDSIPNPKAV